MSIREKRIAFAMKLKKWMRAFKDDILVEQAAIALYKSHIIEFANDFGLPLHPNPLELVNPTVEQAAVDLSVSHAASELGLNEHTAATVIEALRLIVLGVPAERGAGKDRSIRHITLEEFEHIQEFREMIDLLESLIDPIKKSL